MARTWNGGKDSGDRDEHEILVDKFLEELKEKILDIMCPGAPYPDKLTHGKHFQIDNKGKISGALIPIVNTVLSVVSKERIENVNFAIREYMVNVPNIGDRKNVRKETLRAETDAFATEFAKKHGQMLEIKTSNKTYGEIVEYQMIPLSKRGSKIGRELGITESQVSEISKALEGLANYLNSTKFRREMFEASSGSFRGDTAFTKTLTVAPKAEARIFGAALHTTSEFSKDEANRIKNIVRSTVKTYRPNGFTLQILEETETQSGLKFRMSIREERGADLATKLGVIENKFLSYSEFLNENESSSPRDILREFVCTKMVNFLTRRMGPKPTSSLGDKTWSDVVNIFVKNTKEHSIRFRFEIWNEYINYASDHEKVDPDELIALVEHNSKSFAAKKGWTCEIEQDADDTIVTVHGHSERGEYIAGKTGII